MNERSFAIVFGYLPGVDDVYKPAARAGFSRRFAVALNTYRAALGSMYYDHEIFFSVLATMAPLIGFDNIVVHAAGGISSHFRLARLTAPDLTFGAEQEPFNSIDLLQNDRILGMVHFEDYMAIGGPPPYHDTCTFSFYLDNVNADELQQQLQFMAAQQHFGITQVIAGEDKPRFSLLYRLRQLLR